MQTGIVKWYSEDKGYGFIEPESGGKDFFVHYRDLSEGLGAVVEGQRVQFEESDGPKGPQARNVSLIGWAEAGFGT